MEPGSIYTKTGDDGTTGRLFGGRVSKGNDVLEAIGAIDETVAALGLARACGIDAEIGELVLRTQRELFVVGADLSANPRARDRLTGGISEVTSEMVDGLERSIDRLVETHPLRPVFVVPGATQGPPRSTWHGGWCAVRSGASSWPAMPDSRRADSLWSISTGSPTCSMCWHG